jgi:hypothetical protein
MLAMQIRVLKSNLIKSNNLGQKGLTVNELALVYNQWGSGNFLSNQTLNLPNAPALNTVFIDPSKTGFS